ncbi:MAG: hypothetical protein IT431_04315 [Phycisphaerales bacterium]|nr:hypothetical protein [Phycisphaerales bacterium]
MPHTPPPSPTPGAHSATVRLTLRLPDRVIRLGQVGPTHFRCRTPETIPAGPAMLEIEVDGSLTQTRIRIGGPRTPSQHFDYDLDD